MSIEKDLTFRCRACRSTKLHLLVNYSNAPRGIEKLLKHDDLSKDQPIDLKIFRCDTCNFIQQLFSPLPEDYYLTYDKSATCSPSMKEYQIELAKIISSWFPKYGKKVLEAGSGDGFFAACLKNNGAEITAVEPGGPAAQATRNRGVKTIESIS